MKTIKQGIELISVTPDALSVIEKAGRVCYKSEDKITDNSAETFVRNIIKRGHESVLEHASVSFKVTCDRGVSHELVRHRLASFSQESTRYCCYANDKFNNELTVIEPPGLDNVIVKSIWVNSMEHAESSYISLINDGVSPQIARSVLPNCLKTEVIMTANFREWRHVLKLRTSQAAHPQIREVMIMVHSWFTENLPVIVEDIVPFVK